MEPINTNDHYWVIIWATSTDPRDVGSYRVYDRASADDAVRKMVGTSGPLFSPTASFEVSSVIPNRYYILEEQPFEVKVCVATLYVFKADKKDTTS